MFWVTSFHNDLISLNELDEKGKCPLCHFPPHMEISRDNLPLNVLVPKFGKQFCPVYANFLPYNHIPNILRLSQSVSFWLTHPHGTTTLPPCMFFKMVAAPNAFTHWPKKSCSILKLQLECLKLLLNQSKSISLPLPILTFSALYLLSSDTEHPLAI